MNSPALPDSTAPSARPRFGRISKLLLVAGILFLLAGLTIFSTSAHLASREHEGSGRYGPVECLVLKRQLNGLPRQTEEEEYRFRPQLFVRYEISDTEVENWIDAGPETDMPGYSRAQASLERLPTVGQSITCWYEVNDPSVIHFQIGDGGWRTWVTGVALALFTLMPGMGLLLAAWLLRRQP